MAAHALDIQVRLAISEDERRRGGKHEVVVDRIARCSCTDSATYRQRPGCSKCSDGLIARSELLRVTVPADVSIGTKLRLAGKGHATLAGGAGDLFVLLERAPVVAQTSPEPAAPPPRSKLTPKLAIAALAVIIPVSIAVGMYAARPRKPPLGAPCRDSADCESAQCLSLYEPQSIEFNGVVTNLAPRRTGGVCTTGCTTDADCPSTMRCASVERSSALLAGLPRLGPIRPNALACSPP
jgi:hypothetical protein